MFKLLNYFQIMFVHLLLLNVKWVTTHAVQDENRVGFPWQKNGKFFELNFRTTDDVLLQAATDRLNFNIKANELELNRRVQKINRLYNEVIEWARNQYQAVTDYQNKMCRAEQQATNQNQLDANDDTSRVEEKEEKVIEHETEPMQPNDSESDLNENQPNDDGKEQKETDQTYPNKLDLSQGQDYDDKREQRNVEYEDEFPLEDKLGLNHHLDDNNETEEADFDYDEEGGGEEETHQIKSDTNQVQDDRGIEEDGKVEIENVNENQKLDSDNFEKLSTELLRLRGTFKRLEDEIGSHMSMIGEPINEYQASLGKLNTLQEELDDEDERKESYLRHKIAFRNNLQSLLEAIKSDTAHWDVDRSQN
uniref:Uncharacterized protein n=1 Tax=Glossina austeni TaxID=7395 RepID=A0A1A9V0M4_GLOAU